MFQVHYSLASTANIIQMVKVTTVESGRIGGAIRSKFWALVVKTEELGD